MAEEVKIDIKTAADTKGAADVAGSLDKIGSSGNQAAIAAEKCAEAIDTIGDAGKQAGQAADDAISAIGDSAAASAANLEKLATATDESASAAKQHADGIGDMIAAQADYAAEVQNAVIAHEDWAVSVADMGPAVAQAAGEAANAIEEIEIAATKAEGSMGDLAVATQAAMASAEAAAKAAAKGASDATGTASNNAQDSMAKAGQALNIITNASTGNINGMARAVAGLSAALGPIMLIFATFVTAFKAGTKAMDWVWANFVDNIKGIEPVLFKTREQFDELNKVKLDSLSKEVADIQNETNAVLSAIDKAVARSAALRDAKAAAEKARIMAEEPEGPERDLKLAALERSTSEAEIAEQETTARKKLEEMRKAEAAIQERLAKAEAEDRALQERAAEAKARFNEVRTSGNYTRGQVKAAVQLDQEARSSAASLSKLREQLTPQLNQAREGKADAQNQLAVTALQRSTAGSTFSAAQQAAQRQADEDRSKAAARQAREELKAALAAKQEEAKRLPQTMPIDNLNQEAAAQQADVTAADQAISQFKATSRFAPQSHSYQTQLRELESIRAKEQKEADQAVATARATAEALGQAIRSITTEIANLKSQMANLEN